MENACTLVCDVLHCIVLIVLRPSVRLVDTAQSTARLRRAQRFVKRDTGSCLFALAFIIVVRRCSQGSSSPTQNICPAVCLVVFCIADACAGHVGLGWANERCLLWPMYAIFAFVCDVLDQARQISIVLLDQQHQRRFLVCSSALTHSVIVMFQ